MLRQVLDTESVLFVAGSVRQFALGLTIEPSAVVFEKSGLRQMLQPWIAEGRSAPLEKDWSESVDNRELLSRFLEDVEEAPGEGALIGIGQTDAAMEQRWRALIEQGEPLGLVRLLDATRDLYEALGMRRGALAWDVAPSIRAPVRIWRQVTEFEAGMIYERHLSLLGRRFV